MLSNPLLLKELASQARRPGRAGWAYPGPIWFLVVTVAPAVVFLRQGSWEDARPYFLTAAMLQMWLLAFRSSLYAATSMATDVRQGTVPVLLSTPLSLASSLRAKLSACLLPLWVELGFALPLSLLVYSWRGTVPPGTILAVLAFLFTATLFFGGLGMWLGGLLGEPDRAARASRLLVAILLLATSLTPTQLPGPIVLVGLLLWVCLVWLPQVRPNQAVQGSVAALLILLVLPILYGVGRDLMAGFDLTAANPLRALYELGAANAGNPEHQVLLAGDPVYDRAVRESASASQPTLAVRHAIENDEALRARLERLHQAHAVQALLPLGLIYLMGGLGLVRMALGRARNVG